MKSSYFNSVSGRGVRAVSALILAALLVCQVILPCSFVFATDGGSVILTEYCYDDAGTRYKVTAEYDEDAEIPEDAVLKVEALSASDTAYDDYVEMAADALDCRIKDENDVHLFDISLASAADPSVTYQPAYGSSVSVTVRLASSV
ncbi:MAG: hypothetical protein K6G90_06010 [Clostridia bacterium]|nr:hypothetical protein [Clostridia bacterium]